jgi:hypothetical protein
LSVVEILEKFGKLPERDFKLQDGKIRQLRIYRGDLEEILEALTENKIKYALKSISCQEDFDDSELDWLTVDLSVWS